MAKHRHAIIEGRYLSELSLEAIGLWAHIQIQPGDVIDFGALEHLGASYELAGLLIELDDAGLITLDDKPETKKINGKGWVYVIHDGDAYKVGLTKTLGIRMWNLQTGSSRPLVLVWSHQFQDALAIELKMHAHLQEFRVSGEWFKCSRQDINDAIKAVMEA